MFLIVQIGMIISFIQELSRTHSDIQSDLKDNEHAKYIMKVMLNNFELIELDRKAQEEFDAKNK